MLFTQSFSRTCPVKLHYSKSNSTIEGLAIIDDQATQSFVYPQVIEDLGIEQSDQRPTQIVTRTVHGIGQPKKVFAISGLTITPLTNNNTISINALTHEIPHASDMVPTAEEVASIPGLSHLTHNFPHKKDWPTVLLLGRDCM